MRDFDSPSVPANVGWCIGFCPVHRYFKAKSEDGDNISLRSRPLKGSKGN